MLPPAPAPAPVQQAAPAVAPAPDGKDYTVRSGDTLSEIARDHTEECGSGADLATCWHGLYEQNRDVIGADPNRIFPGQTLHFVGGLALASPPQPAAPEGGQVGNSAPAPAVQLQHAPIANGLGPVQPEVQHAADVIFTNVPGAQLITIGGTGSRGNVSDHPGGLALDYMVLGDVPLGDAIVQYHMSHWDELGVKYIIYKQHIMLENGVWEAMEDRGSVTANHYDHVHVSYH